MLILGITGSFATGKSTVAKMFERLGAKRLDADAIVHELLKNFQCQKQIVRNFGTEIFGKGGINRKKLAQIVFNDAKQLKKLERILHPLVKNHIQDYLKDTKKRSPKSVVVMEVPLLFEAGFDKLCDRTLVVEASGALQIKRAKAARHLSTQQIKTRIQSQMGLKSKILLADYIIDNSKNVKQTKRQVLELWQKLSSRKEKQKIKKKT